ncbi:MAG: GNAT family N-acetyltransferase [Sphaerochaetaceae bacterium]
MLDITFRQKPLNSDLVAVRSILKRTGFFTKEEQEIGASLLEQRLLEGISCGYHFLFGLVGKIVVGYSCFGPIPMTQSGCDLYWIAVDPAYQKEGVGGQLISRTEQICLQLGKERLYAETSGKQLYQPTRRFYEQCGFELEARQSDYYAPQDDRLLYVKKVVK